MHTLISIGARHWQLEKDEELVLLPSDLVDQVDVWSISCRIYIMTVDESVWYEKIVRGFFKFNVLADLIASIIVSPPITIHQLHHQSRDQFKVHEEKLYQPKSLQLWSGCVLKRHGYPLLNLPKQLQCDTLFDLTCQEFFDH